MNALLTVLAILAAGLALVFGLPPLRRVLLTGGLFASSETVSG
jgi:type IV secretory pathway VirB2 component (pilin)